MRMPGTFGRSASVALAALAVIAGCGSPGSSSGPVGSASVPASSVQVVQVRMLDTLRYDPDPIRVKPGTVRFEVTNAGATTHEFFVGTEAEQQKHEQDMAGGHGHGGAKTLELEGGKSGTIEVTFDAPGQTLVGCHEPGHYPGGMKATIVVES